MTSMMFFIPIEDLELFKEKSKEMSIEILDSISFHNEGLTQLNVLVEDFTGIYIIGSMVGYAKAYDEATTAMNQALYQLNELKEKFEKLQNLQKELETIKNQSI